jgi:hypothetical protein
MASVILHTHQCLGDQLICNGLVREYCKTYDKVAIFCTPQYYESVSFMYRDISNLRIVKGDEGYALLFMFLNEFRRGYDKVKIAGTPYLDPYRDINDLGPCERDFYIVAGVDPRKKWDSFHVERDAQREENLFRKIAPPSDYVFLHDDARFRIDREKVISYPIISPVVELTNNIFDYCALIEKAKEIHVIDSSFMYIVDLLPDFGQKLFIHRYARPNSTWTLPSLKKKWNIIQ